MEISLENLYVDIGIKGLSRSERFYLKVLVLISLTYMVNGVQLAQLEVC